MKRCRLLVLVAVAFVSTAHAAVVVDGVRSPGEYVSALAVQTVETQFGDSPGSGSELDAAYATVTDDTLYLMLTGNLEGNFNNFDIFFDSRAGGQNIIVGGSNPTNGWAANFSGMQFDTNFIPDFHIFVRHSSAFLLFHLDYAVIGGSANSYDTYTNVFSGSNQGSAMTSPGANLGYSFMIGFSNSNVAGVSGGTAAANQSNALAVTTGLELGISLAALGIVSNPRPIRISAMVNNGDHNYLSNQFLGGLPAPQGNLGGDGMGGFTGTLGGINLNSFAGSQFFVVPELGPRVLFDTSAGVSPVKVTFNSVTGRVYAVDFISAIASNPQAWVEFTNGIAGTGGQITITNANNSTSRNYRARGTAAP